jgi:hypothetical protein
MNLLWLFLFLALTGLLFMWVEPFLVMPLVMTLALFKNEKNPLAYVISAVAMLWQMDILLAWCVVCLFFTLAASSKLEVKHHWMYYVLGFLGCLAPIQAMASYEREPNKRTLLKSPLPSLWLLSRSLRFQSCHT